MLCRCMSLAERMLMFIHLIPGIESMKGKEKKKLLHLYFTYIVSLYYASLYKDHDQITTIH